MLTEDLVEAVRVAGADNNAFTPDLDRALRRSRSLRRRRSAVALGGAAACALVATSISLSAGSSVADRIQVVPATQPPTFTASTVPSSMPSASQVCTSAALSPSYIPGEGAGGQSYFVVSLQNVGDHACTLQGWPTVTLLDQSGKPIGPASIHRDISMTGTGLVALAPGQTAGITVGTGSTAVPTDCLPIVTSGITLTLPETQSTLFVPATLTVCSKAGSTGLTTSPIYSGTAIRL